jgi:hypothetical protein
VAILSCAGWLARLQLIAAGRYFHAIETGGVATSSNSGWFVSTVSALPTLALIYFAAVLRLRLASGHRRAFVGLAVLEIAWAIPSGTRASLAALALAFLVVQYYATRTFPWKKTLIAAVVMIFVVMPVGLAYRATDTPYQDDPRGALRAAGDAVVGGGIGALYASGTTATLSRLSPVASVAVVSRNSTNPMGITLTDSAREIAGGFVPRFLWPQKSDPGLFGNEFGRAYGILRPDDFVTSIAPTEVADVVVRGGFTSLLVVMPLLGFAYGLLSYALRRRWDSPVALALYAVAAWSIFYEHGVSVALGVTGTLKLLIAFGLALGASVWIARRGWQGDRRVVARLPRRPLAEGVTWK